MYTIRISTINGIYLVTLAILTTLSRTPQHVPQVRFFLLNDVSNFSNKMSASYMYLF